MRKLIWFLVVVVVLAVVVDRGADYVAERVVAKNLAASQKLDRRPDVAIDGFPFLTQLAHQRYDKVTATANGVPVGSGDRRVTLSRVEITFRDVTTNRDFTRFHAARGDATATVSYAALGRVLDLDVRYAGAGKVTASRRVEVAGQTFKPGITVEPSLVDGALAFTNAALSDGVPDQLAQVLRSAFRIDLPLTRLPFDVHVDSLRAQQGGVVLRLTGTDLSYTRS